MLSARLAQALLAALLAAGLALALTACGEDGSSGGGDRSSAPSGSTPTGATGSRGAGRFPDRPQVDLDFAQGASDELAALERPGGVGVSAEGSYRLRLVDGAAVRAPARRVAEPGTAAVSVVGTVRAPTRLDGRAGIFCRGTADGRTGYELSVDRGGRARLERVQDGRRTLLAGYGARIDAAVPPDEPLPLVLACGTGTEPGSGVTLGIAVGVQEMTFIGDRQPLDPGPRGLAGLVVSGGAPATADFAAFQLSFARP